MAASNDVASPLEDRALPLARRYEEARAAFAWNTPEFFNIGVDVTDKWAARDAERIAIIDATSRPARHIRFGELAEQSNRLANALVAQGLRRGDRVAVLAPQRAETAIAHAAIYKAGAIAVPLFSLFGLDALRFRLADSGARFLFTDAAGRSKVAAIRAQLPELQAVFCMDGHDEASLTPLMAQSSPHFDAVNTRADDPALIIYTSGTTGPPKGALHAHRVLLGHLPGVEMSHDAFPQAGDRIWTPADWAWIGGLLDVLLPALHHGVSVIAKRFEKFDAAAAFQLLEEHGIRNVFLPPTALKMLRGVTGARQRWRFSLRSVASGGESLGAELLEWGRRELGVTINEFYGQTECNIVLSSSDAWFAPRPGAIGKAVPGHDVRIIDEHGRVLSAGEEGHIAVRSPDPVMFIGYWRNDVATGEKFLGEWLVTGDRGHMDDDGFIHFKGREDDVITSAGYRIGPGEIEDCLLRHEAIAAAGVVGVPDALRTEVVTAFVVLKPGYEGSVQLADDLRHHVRSRCGAHQYPRALHFATELPLTVTGKIIRRALRERALELTSRDTGAGA